jgi:hypothetical protein
MSIAAATSTFNCQGGNVAKAGEVQRMKESYDQDSASQVGPESCGGDREVTLEALTGVRAGRAIEPRQDYCPGRRRSLRMRKATSIVSISARGSRVPRGRRTCARTEAPHKRRQSLRIGSREISLLGHWQIHLARVVNPPKEQDDDERA